MSRFLLVTIDSMQPAQREQVDLVKDVFPLAFKGVEREEGILTEMEL